MADTDHPSLCIPRKMEYHLTTNLSTKVNSFNRLTDRILWQLGAPTINVEISRDAIFNAISMACELYTKYAGTSREYIVFHSSLYNRHKGIRLDELFSVRDKLVELGDKNPPELSADNSSFTKAYKTSFNADIEKSKPVYTCVEAISLSSYPNSSLSSIPGFENGIARGKIIDYDIYEVLTDPLSGGEESLSANFIPSTYENIPVKGLNTDKTDELEIYNNSFDYDIMDYRKVNAVVDFQMGESTGINTLFTIEQTLAQQTYFSYAMGNYGFDLISWYTLKDWLDTRQKLLSINPQWKFNNRTQILTLYPEPTNSQYWGVLGCQVELPLKDLLKVNWVQRYSLALTMITLGHIRGKFNSLTLFGSGSFNASDIMTQGLEMKKELEKELFEGTTPGFGEDSQPVGFLIG